MALAVLGVFVFYTDTIPFNSKAWKHPHQSVVGSMPRSQYTGKDPDEISIQAELRPEITGGDGSLAMLQQMADTGQPYPLILGTGVLMGSYVITNVQIKRSELMYDSKARSIAFSMSLKKVADHAFGMEGEALGLAVGMVRAWTRI